jgi:osmotically-inducible protein OsmY
MKTDAQIQKDVLDQLKGEPFLDASEIGVAVKNGIVTLSGIVDSYSKKIVAEKVAKKIAGVRALAVEIQVGLSPNYRKTDTEIAEGVANALRWHTMIPDQKISISVENGSVKMEGEVDWDYQRRQASKAIQDLVGVRSVTNLIKVKDKLTTLDIQ